MELIRFHANFLKEAGPMVSGETRVTFDVPEIFDEELSGIRQKLKNKNLIIRIYEDVEENNFENSEGV